MEEQFGDSSRRTQHLSNDSSSLEEAEHLRPPSRRLFCLSSSADGDGKKDKELDLAKQSAHAWFLFQDAATNISRLYQDRVAGRDGRWHNFQNAASAISMLYKESVEVQQRSFDAGYRAGVEKAYNELMEWVVGEPRKRKHVRTDDLVNFIYSPRNPASLSAKRRPERSHANLDSLLSADLHDLQTFRDALHVQSLNGAMAHFNVNRSPARTSPSRSLDLHAFVTEEIRRHKRSSSLAFGLDPDEMDDLSPYKRARFTPPKQP